MLNATPKFQIMTITPAIARDWLKHNVKNRSLAERTVQRYAKDMAAGLWEFAADPIRFDIYGNLIDGQHRLAAVASMPEGFAINFLVVTKLETNTQMVMDQGRQRLSADQLAIAGFKSTAALGAAIKLHITHDEGLLFRDAKLAGQLVTKAAIVAWAEQNRPLVEQVGTIPHIGTSDAPISVAMCAALMFVPALGYENTVEFFRLLNAGTGEGNPINALDRRFRLARRNKVKLSQRDGLAYFITAANAWMEGRRLTKLQTPRGGRWTQDNFPKLVVAR